MKTIIAGSRCVVGKHLVDKAIEDSEFEITEVVSGGARGVDRLGELVAAERGIPVKQFKADWKAAGRGAGFKTNADMAQYADALIAIPYRTSSGTVDIIQRMEQLGKPVFVWAPTDCSVLAAADEHVDVRVGSELDELPEELRDDWPNAVAVHSALLQWLSDVAKPGDYEIYTRSMDAHHGYWPDFLLTFVGFKGGHRIQIEFSLSRLADEGDTFRDDGNVSVQLHHPKIFKGYKRPTGSLTDEQLGKPNIAAGRLEFPWLEGRLATADAVVRGIKFLTWLHQLDWIDADRDADH